MTPAPVPATIGRFRVESVLGTGGMGAVYKAFDPTLKRTVAVKTVLPGINSPEALQRLLLEAQACAGLHHPHIVTIYDAGEIDGGVYVAMEYLVGENLDVALKRGSLTLIDTLDILIQVTDALAHAHEAGVVHRDIKPGNIYRQSDGSIKLVDFGLARMSQSEQLTAVGVILGTPAYASPEQLRGDKIDARTDIYATGVVAYEMIAGRRPFIGAGDIGALFYKVIHEPVPPMNVVASRTFPELEAIVQKAMAKDPAERHRTAAALRDEFRRFLDANRQRIAAGADEAGQATVVAVRPVTSPPAVTTNPPGATPVAAPVADAAAPVPAAPAVAPVAAPAPRAGSASPRRSSNGVMLIAAAAIVAVLALAGWFLLGRSPASDSPSPDATRTVPAPPVAAPAGAPAGATTPPLPPVVTPAAAAPPPTTPPQTGTAAETSTPTAGAASAPESPVTAAPANEPSSSVPAAAGAGRDTAEPQRSASSPPANRAAAPARRTERPSAATSPVSPATRAAYDRRCTQLNDRASVGETLSAEDRAFLIRNCGSSGKGSDAPR